jgi:hypothetical protein
MSLRLSVGVAASQDTAGLVRVLESLFQQERPFDQVVVALEGETPSLTPLLKRYRKQIQTMDLPTGLMPTQQWNLMEPHLTGDWISLLTAEDCVRPNFAKEVELTVTAFPGASILRGGWLRIRSDGRPGERFTLNSVRACVKPADALYEQRFGPKGSLSACAVRRSAWQEAGLFPPELPLLGDWALWLQAGAVGDTIRSREILAEHRTPVVTADLARSTAEIEETFRIYRDVLPQATARAGIPDPTWIGAASRKRFRDVAIAASSRFSPAVRGPLLEALRPWAATVEQGPLLERLDQGDRIRDFNLARRIRPVLKRVISAVR